MHRLFERIDNSIEKSVFTRFVLADRNLVNFKLAQNIATRDAHGVYLVHVFRVYVHIIAWASVLLVRAYRQYQSLYRRNSKIAVPLFILLDEDNKIDITN